MAGGVERGGDGAGPEPEDLAGALRSGVRYRVASGVGTVTLDRPGRLNAINASLVEELIAVLETAAGDGAVRCVVLTGAGRGFCAGGDLKEMAAASGRGPATERGVEDRAADLRRLMRATELLYAMPKVTIAAVNGPCAGAGLSLACATDVRVAAESAVFTSAFLRAGQTGDFGLSWLLPRLVGAARAREVMLLSGRFDARRALEIGLVSEVVPDDALAARVAELAATVAGFPPLAVAGMKGNLDDAATRSLGELLDVEARRMAVNSATRDAREAVVAFAEGRP
ncbi:MAG TPA: enoyl-CoA hydratase-related protein, partial [Acidimicrobiales bacterium]|nr:enoyl-CoA hydratase-related protein [Acidimicrobiales bacterium]